MSEQGSNSKQLWLVLAVFVAVISGVFLLTQQDSLLVNKQATPVVLGDSANKNYQIIIYYFPEKEHEAEALTYIFQEQGYNIAMEKAESVPALNGTKRSPSHIFFNRSDMDKAMKIKLLIEEVIGKSVNAYRFQEPQTDPSMMMVFTEV
ncbi:MAG: hypothetical protein HRU05_10145 [Oceanospirillaceae bacterium]|nr:hypothetical protein [Oceanospirillaceae bacterium]